MSKRRSAWADLDDLQGLGSPWEDTQHAHVPPAGYDGRMELDELVSIHRPPAPRSRLRRVVRAMLRIVALLIAALVGVGLVWLALGMGGNDVPDGERIELEIPDGADAAEVATLLAEERIISSELLFRLRMRMGDDEAGIIAGDHVFTTGAAYDAIVKELKTSPPPAPTYSIAIPEGYRISDTAQRVEGLRADTIEAGRDPVVPAFRGPAYVAAAERMRIPAALRSTWQVPSSVTTLEGFLFPSTYELLDAADARTLINRQLTAFAEQTADIDFSYARSRGLTPYDVLIIASMIEREARVAEERPTIAAVIYNRLKIDMLLGIDATVQYIADPDEWKRELTVSDLAIDSPYNTRLNPGLPPTPIASPGLDSIRAAAQPANVDYLYYVAKPDGSGEHTFHREYSDFLAAQQ